ncbi:hypothetical protein EC988_007793 [Linderina pennispora]|nr:hypothetical protein EC988_007793 [Linderina pennispora]
MSLKYTVRWMVNKMWPRIDGSSSYSTQKDIHESQSRRNSSLSETSTLNSSFSNADFFSVDTTKLKALNMMLRV